jgi:thiamine-monophosphate kinase
MSGRRFAGGEFELIERLAAHLEPLEGGVGIGDDAAAWQPTPGRVVVATTDMLVEGIHFRLDWIPPRDLGWKALAVNLSDLAAMGAKPGHALVSIALLAGQADLAEEIYEGLAELARATGTRIVGGDTVRSPGPLVVNVALVGEADPERLLRRTGARPGDLLAVTGTVGASAAGLDLLIAEGRKALDRPGGASLVAAHHRPRPQLEAGAALAAHGVRCAIDISDGVASEARHLARAGGMEIEVDVDLLPLASGAVSLLGEARARRLALTGGEDYQLLFTVPEANYEEVARALPPDAGATVVGRVTAARDDGEVRFLEAGAPIDIEEAGYVAF